MKKCSHARKTKLDTPAALALRGLLVLLRGLLRVLLRGLAVLLLRGLAVLLLRRLAVLLVRLLLLLPLLRLAVRGLRLTVATVLLSVPTAAAVRAVLLRRRRA